MRRLESKRDYRFICDTEAERNLWVTDIKKAVDESTLKQDKVTQKAKELQYKDWSAKEE